MTTLYGSKKDLTLSIGFFVLVVAAIAVSLLVRGSTVAGVVFAAVALGLIVLAIVLSRRPANELHVTSELIELTRPNRTIGGFSREDTGGHVEIRRHIFRGRAFWSLLPAGAPRERGLPVDDFVPDEIRSAAEPLGWKVDIVE